MRYRFSLSLRLLVWSDYASLNSGLSRHPHTLCTLHMVNAHQMVSCSFIWVDSALLFNKVIWCKHVHDVASLSSVETFWAWSWSKWWTLVWQVCTFASLQALFSFFCLCEILPAFLLGILFPGWPFVRVRVLTPCCQWTYQHGVFTDQLQVSIFYYAPLLCFSDQYNGGFAIRTKMHKDF